MNLLLSSSVLLCLFACSAPAAAELRLSAPLDYQVFQRSAADAGKILVEGELPAGVVGPAVVEVQFGGAGIATSWRRLTTVAAGQSNFRAELESPAGGWYRLDVRVTRGQEVLAETNVTHVGVGEVFVVAGQSNSANHGEEKQKPVSDLVVAFSGKR